MASMKKHLVIYHADCADGFGAAFVAWLALGDDAEYLPMQYKPQYKDEDVPSPEGRDVYILDFSFPRIMMDDIFKRAKRVVWLDHHKTAFEMWYETERSKYFDPCCGPNNQSLIILDNNKSGALLAWEFFQPSKQVPELIQLIDDRDRWQFNLEGSKELHAQLMAARPWSFEQWKSVFFGGAIDHNNVIALLKQQGAVILQAQAAAVAQTMKHARKCMIQTRPEGMKFITDFHGLAVSCPLHQSEIGHELANKSGTYGLIWYMNSNGSVICSLRSNGDYDVSAIAKAFGGGGHRNAAGFQTDVETLIGWLR